MTKVTKFFREVADELRKTTWPWDPKERGFKKFRELIDSTTVVFIAMILLAGWIAGWDVIINKFMLLLTWLVSR